MTFATVDLCDQHQGRIQVALPLFQSYGAHEAFCGRIATARCFEDNTIVREILSRPGEGGVLVVDAGGSLRRALVGDVVAGLGARNGWAGLVLYGCVRDVRALAEVPIGIRALNHVPLPSEKLGWGVAGGEVQFAGVTFTPGHYLYADVDGIVVSPVELT
jgi:regulator of ribonuclease activity A